MVHLARCMVSETRWTAQSPEDSVLVAGVSAVVVIVVAILHEALAVRALQPGDDGNKFTEVEVENSDKADCCSVGKIERTSNEAMRVDALESYRRVNLVLLCALLQPGIECDACDFQRYLPLLYSY
jgi:hypothetical protein